MFRNETKVIKESLRSEQIQEYEEVEGILYYQGRIAPENQLKTQDLDGCKFFDFTEIGQPVPVVLEDSPVLYAYIMWIHNKIPLMLELYLQLEMYLGKLGFLKD